MGAHIFPSLVLAQPRKTCSCLTERLLMGRKESNQIKQKHGCSCFIEFIKPVKEK